ncbi:MAG TPA: tetratricopeptide repeat protein [Burkholderiales bacterium]|nr:tetratricopeptide repeat protein [Burkholderiales bacterium]
MGGLRILDRKGAVALGVIAVLACALYLPFVSNPIVFDDHGLFTGSRFYEYASFPFGLSPRWPASFSVAFVYVLFGSIEAQRVVGAVLHAAVGCGLFFLIRELQRNRAENTWVAAAVATLFVVHPLAVYGAAYLAQRSLILATLFSVLSAAAFTRGLHTGRYAWAIGAAALYSIAVLSKEHAILVPGAIALIAWVASTQRPFALRYAVTYLAACAPAAIFVFLLLKGIVGQPYEVGFKEVAAEVSLSGEDMIASPWLSSVLTQLWLFPRYVLLWLLPDTARMSFDQRVDFASTWSFLAVSVSVLVFAATGALGTWLVSRRGRAGLIGFGILWFWLCYLIEFSVARFQEPFVLYRSYLWAPGIVVALAVLAERIPARAVAISGVVLAAGLAWQAHDRLRTFSSGLALWEDAAAKLPPAAIPGGSRPLYQLGREYFYAGQVEKAEAVVDRCIALYPGMYRCLFARAAMLVSEEKYEAALPALAVAIAEKPSDGVTRHHLGLALQGLGCREQARAQYELSVKLGFWGGVERLKSLDGKGGILPAAHIREPVKPFPCAEALKGIADPGR